MSKRIRKRHMILLEILIAMAIVTLCILPLISPYAWILTAEKNHTKEMQLDRAISLLYVDVLERLYKPEIFWGEIEGGKVFAVDEQMWRRIGHPTSLPYHITYQFSFIKKKHDGNKSKGKMEPEWILGLYTLTFSASPINWKDYSKPKWKFSYDLPILRHPGGPVPLDQQAVEETPEAAKPTEQKNQEE